MYDPEDTRQTPTTWREYLAQSKEMVSAIQWAWREFKTPQVLHWYRRLIAAAMIMTAFSVAQPKLLAILFDGVAARNQQLTIIGVAGFLFCLIMQRVVDSQHGKAREWLLGLNNGELDDYITKCFFGKSMGQHVEENFRLNPESIMTGRERLLSVQSLLFFEGIPTAIGLTFSYILLWILSPVIGLVLTGFLCLYGIYVLYLNQKVIEACTPIEVEWRRLKRYRFERMKNIERVKTSAKENDELDDMNRRFEDTIQKDRSFWLWYIRHVLKRGMILVIGLIVILFYGITLVWTGRWMIGALIPLVMWSMQIVENVWRIGHIERQLNWCMPSIRHMIEALSIPPAITSKPGATVLSKNESIEIAFDGITHAYPLDSDDGGKNTASPFPVLKNVTFSIEQGERVALIGPSGAGKTTLMKLLLRFMDPEQGAIRINGHDLRDIDLSSWMRSVAYIPQHAQILDGTIRYNLTYGLSPEERCCWTDDRLWELMRKLRIDFGERLYDGLETVVGERGIKLSGGQAQRVMIGAAAIQHPPFMIVDEATSHLDSSTERAVHDGLAEVLSDRVGALIIAHRLSTVRDLCNERDGKYYQGNHEPLISKQLFDDAQRVMSGASRPRPNRLFFPLRGFLTCASCGCLLTASVHKGHQYYYCTNGKGKCDQHKVYLREDDAYKLVANLFDNLIFTDRKIELMYRAAKEDTEKNGGEQIATLSQLNKILASLLEKESKLLDAFLAEQITKELYDRKVSDIQFERIALNKQIREAEKKQGVSTLEPTKKLFKQANTAKKEFLAAGDAKKRVIVSELLWNLSLENKLVRSLQYKTPFDVIAKAPKNGNLNTMLGGLESDQNSRIQSPLSYR